MALFLPPVPVVRRSLAASWELFRGREEGMRDLDVSLEGFWRSFAVIVLLLPLNAILVLAEMRLLERTGEVTAETFPFTAFALAKFAGLAVDWVAFPILLALFAGWLQVTRTYVPYVVARNWAAPLALSLSAIPAILFAAGMIGEEIAVIVFLVVLVVVLRFHYLILRIALKVEPGLALALVIADLVLSIMISQAFAGLARP